MIRAQGFTPQHYTQCAPLLRNARASQGVNPTLQTYGLWHDLALCTLRPDLRMQGLQKTTNMTLPAPALLDYVLGAIGQVWLTAWFSGLGFM